MNRCLPILLVSSLPIFSVAQSHFTPGYIVKTSGDTVRGFLEEELRTELVNQIRFKPDNTVAAELTYTPNDLTTFKYETGNLYRSITFVSTETDSLRSQSCFALQLVTGTYSLYSYLKEDQTYFVVIGKELSYQLYNATYNHDGGLEKEGNYISRLGLLSGTCPKMSFHVDQITYSEKDISRFVFDLNNCISPSTASINYYQKAKTQIQFIFYGGGILLGKNKNQLTADMSVRLMYPQLSKNVFINIGAHFSYTTKQQTEKEFGSNVLLNKTTDQIISAPVTLQYNFTNGVIQPFIYGGFAAAYLQEKVTYYSYSSPIYGKPDKFGISAIAAVGVEARLAKKLYIKAEWRYELMLQYPSIGVSYIF